MEKPIEEMTYREFMDYCNDRASDGRWSMVKAIVCSELVKEVEAAVKGKIFKRRAREIAWRNVKSKYSLRKRGGSES